MRKFALTLAVAAVAAATTLAMAEPPAGYGMGMGKGCAVGAGADAGAACPQGGGPGMGRGPGNAGGYGMHGGGAGMSLLTPEERTVHRENMHSLKSVEECEAYLAQHHELLQARAKANGVATPPGPRGNMCERMKARGMFG